MTSAKEAIIEIDSRSASSASCSKLTESQKQVFAVLKTSSASFGGNLSRDTSISID